MDGDRIWVQLHVWEIYLGLTNHPCQLSLAIHPWVGAMSSCQRVVTGDAVRHGVKAVSVICIWWQIKVREPL